MAYYLAALLAGIINSSLRQGIVSRENVPLVPRPPDWLIRIRILLTQGAESHDSYNHAAIAWKYHRVIACGTT